MKIMLRNKLREKINEQRMNRSSKQKKEQVLSKNLKKIGIDKDKLKKDLEALKKLGGLTIKL